MQGTIFDIDSGAETTVDLVPWIDGTGTLLWLHPGDTAPAGFVAATQAQVDAAALAHAQADKLLELRAAYEVAITLDVTFTTAGAVTKAFQADENSQSVLARMLAACEKTASVPVGFYWVSRDNTQVPFTYADMQGLAAAMGAQGWAAFQNLQNKKAAVLAAATVAAVQAVVW